jgi:G:T/U-mismatch repair DNA glycosylase
VSKYTYYRREGSSTLNGFSDKFFDCIYFTDEIIKITEKKFPQFTDYAVANKISTSLRVLKRMYTMGGVKKYPNEHDKLIEYVKSYDKAFCKKYLKKNDYIRYSALKTGKLPFKILTKYFDKY